MLRPCCWKKIKCLRSHRN